jgi:excisionase family DNA binding protein
LTDFSKELNISASQTYALVRIGELPAIQIGGPNQWRVERSTFEEYIQEAHGGSATT